jgi:hypothetical protein
VRRSRPRPVTERPDRRGRKTEEGVGHWKEEERGKEALTRGATLLERERRERARLGREKGAPTGGPGWQWRKKRGPLGGELGWLLGRASPRGKEGGGRKEVAAGERAGPRGFGLVSFPLLFLFFSHT